MIIGGIVFGVKFVLCFLALLTIERQVQADVIKMIGVYFALKRQLIQDMSYPDTSSISSEDLN